MAYDLGDTVILAADCRDAAGVLANATTVTLTVTLPDGTTTPHTPANPPAATGKYTHPYVTLQSGLHRFRWTFAGAVPDQAYVDAFYVRSADPYMLVSLADVKAHLNISATDTTYDEELRNAIEVASDVAESYAGVMARKTVTEIHSSSGGCAVVLRRPPVLSVTSVTENGTDVAASGYSLSDTGILYRVSGYSDTAWLAGRNNITITYVAGVTVIPPSVLDAVKDLVRLNFSPQLGGTYSPFDSGETSPGETRFGFFVPNRIIAALMRNSLNVGIA